MIVDFQISWQLTIIILLVILFFFYLLFGGKKYEYLGLNPLQIGYDASRCKEHSYMDDEIDNETDEDVDENGENGEINEELIYNNVPVIPDLSNVEVSNLPIKDIRDANEIKKNIFDVTRNISLDILVDSYDNKYDIPSCVPCTPRRAALGPYKCYNSSKKSKGELLCKQALEEIYGKPFHCVRPDFLKNPETGRNLELDLYNNELKIALEYQGKAHFIYPNYFHRTEEEFINQVRRDTFKINRCDENGVYLISVPFNVPLNLEDIKKYIIFYLPENYKLRQNANLSK